MLCVISGSPLVLAQQPGASTELPSQPFAIKNTWTIGGSGSWDYLTMDAPAQRLYIAHGHAVQAVDTSSGTVAGQITGLVEAHAIALDDSGEFGYISDGPGGKVVVFDRRTLGTVATIEDVPSPRALVFEPQTKLLFAIRTGEAPAPRPSTLPRTTIHITPRPAPPPPPPPDPNASSSITVIDTQTRKIAAQILVPDTLGFAQADSRGNLFVSATDHNRILVIDAQTIAGLLAKMSEPTPIGAPSQNTAPQAAPGPAAVSPPPRVPTSSPSSDTKKPAAPATIQWDQRDHGFRSFSLSGGCTTPKSLAIDSAHQRLFAACDNQKLSVLNAESGESVATLAIGPGVDAIGYDPGRNLIYTANGGADGTLTIISQSVTDSYAVIQTLPTRQRARTLAVNPDNGQVYLVTDLLGVNLSQPGAMGTLRTDPVNGTFQVLVIGN
jgi:DNA-binding beta-propeller fold protein YncE